MRLNVFNRKKTVLEKLASTYDVKLDASASQLIMDVLTKLYDNPVEAAIREYVSNAYDANVEAGSTEPVHLHVPTEDKPYLEVSDTGNGLDYLGIVSVFANFGTSTKRDSDTLIGGFGIGSKSGLAISDKIHVSSVCNGLLNEFVIERKDGILQTRFIVENKETTSTSGTTVTIKVQDTFVHDTTNTGLNEYHYVIHGWSTKELIVTNRTKNCAFMNDNRVPDTFHKIPNTNTWLSKTELDCTRTFYANQHVRIGRVLYRIPDNIVRKLQLRVPMPKVGYNDIEFITPKTKKEYNYLISLDPGTPTINADDIANLNNYLNSWQICPNGINVLKTAQIFRDICTDKDKYLHSDLWSKTPFANQNYIERKMCCLSQCYYFDGYSFVNKDLVTKAYSKYAGYISGHIERDEALEIIDHINNTCASEIATLNQMLSDLDPLIK